MASFVLVLRAGLFIDCCTYKMFLCQSFVPWVMRKLHKLLSVHSKYHNESAVFEEEGAQVSAALLGYSIWAMVLETSWTGPSESILLEPKCPKFRVWLSSRSSAEAIMKASSFSSTLSPTLSPTPCSCTPSSCNGCSIMLYLPTRSGHTKSTAESSLTSRPSVSIRSSSASPVQAESDVYVLQMQLCFASGDAFDDVKHWQKRVAQLARCAWEPGKACVRQLKPLRGEFF